MTRSCSSERVSIAWRSVAESLLAGATRGARWRGGSRSDASAAESCGSGAQAEKQAKSRRNDFAFVSPCPICAAGREWCRTPGNQKVIRGAGSKRLPPLTTAFAKFAERSGSHACQGLS